MLDGVEDVFCVEVEVAAQLKLDFVLKQAAQFTQALKV